MGRPGNTDERRQQIVQAMKLVVARHGYERASIADIAEAAGLASGLVHYHFSSKQEIFVQLARTLADGLRSRLEVRLSEAGDDPRATLRAFIDVHLALGPDSDADAVACWVNVATEAIRQEPLRAVYREAVDQELRLLETLVRDCLEERKAPTRSAKAIAAGLFAAIEGYFLLSAADPSLVPAGSAARTVRLMAEGLIGQAS